MFPPNPSEVGCSGHWFFNWACDVNLKSRVDTLTPKMVSLTLHKLVFSWSNEINQSAHYSSIESASTSQHFLQAEPWQGPHAKEHFMPFFLQVQRPELQSVVQSQCMIFKRSAGAGDRSVKMETNPDSVTFQPHDSSL